MKRVWQLIFSSLLVWSVAYVVVIKGQFSIDTGLADVAPSIASNEQTHQAIASLRRNIEKRILFLVSGRDEDAVLDAVDDLQARLEQNSALHVLPNGDELLDDVISALEPHRFHLLSDAQRQRLHNESPVALAAQARRDIHSMAAARLYPFDKDPFGVSSASVFEVLQNLQSGNKQTSDLTHETLVVSLAGDALNMRQQAVLSDNLNQAIEAVIAQHKVSVDRSGVFFFASHAAQESKRDVSMISTVSTVSVVLLLLFVFRNLGALLLPVVSVVLGVGFAFLLTHLVYGNVHVLTIVFGASLIGIVIDYSLHYFYHTIYQSAALPKANSQEHAALHNALLLSLSTSLIGYAALSFSGLQALTKVALFSCCGLIMAWLSVVCLGPLVAGKKLNVEASVLGTTVNRLLAATTLLSRRVIGLSVAALLLAALSCWFISKPFSDDPRVFFTAPAELLDSERKVAAVANDYEPGRYVLLLGSSIAEIQARFDDVKQRIGQHISLNESDFVSILSLVPSQADQASAYQLQQKLYGVNAALDQLSQGLDGPDGAGESEGLQGLAIEPAVLANLKQDYQAASTRYLSPVNIHQVLGSALPPMWFENQDGYVGFVLIKKGVNADALTHALAGVDGVEYVNTLEKTQAALAKQRQSASLLLALAYALVAILLLLRFRKVSAVGMLAVPLASSAMLVLLSLPFSYQLNLFHIMALFLVLGFGMDYTIFVRQMKDHQAQTLQAIMLSAITSLLSFGLLSLSNIPVVASFGTALLIGNSVNLLGAFVYSRLTVENTHSHNDL